MEALLDNIYGAWFFPDRTFRFLRDNPPIWQAGSITILLNVLDAGRRGGFSLLILLAAAISGLVGWVILGALLRGLAYTFNLDPRFDSVLVLIAFGGLPWIFLAPAQALGGPLGALGGLAALVWFAVWELRAAAIALEIPWERLIWIVPLAFVGGIVAMGWTSSTLSAILSLG
ncbi:MAG: YIP1 family protein [Synechococcus sp.]